MGNNIKVNGITDFPDGTVFTISVNRPYKRVNNTDSYGGWILEDSICVNQGKFDFAFNVDDKKWIDEYSLMRKQNS